MALKYIDISKYQNKPDFTKVKAAGVDGIIIRAGYGRNNIDEQFKRNISECNRLDIPCGVYWFSYAYTEEMARKEAEYCLAAIKPYKVELPVCFDFEYDSVSYAEKNGINVTKELATSLVHAFCGAVEASGYYAMNYANPDFLNRYFDDTTSRYDLWLAVWPEKPNPDNPPRKCGIWQWGGSAIHGIETGLVDTNAAYNDYAAIIRNAGLNRLNEKPEVSEAEKARQWVIGQGISDGTRGDVQATRSELWTMLYRMSGAK